jgi:hypothetical protein
MAQCCAIDDLEVQSSARCREPFQSVVDPPAPVAEACDFPGDADLALGLRSAGARLATWVATVPGLPGIERPSGCVSRIEGVPMSSRVRLLVVLVALLSVADVVLLTLYAREVGRTADTLVALEYAQGAAAIATARASRCFRTGP